MSSFVDKSLSLVERKKQQWALEREELARLNSIWSRDSSQPREQNLSRSRNASKGANPEYARRDSSCNRKQSLPPLYKNQNFTYSSTEKLDKEMGGETSGYGSDNQNSPEHYKNANSYNGLGYESSSSGREDRPKWGDKGVHVGKFWEPKQEELKAVNDPPGWVKRGLERNTQLEVSNTSPAESPEQDIGRDRPCTSSSSSQNRSYIRGQNIYLEPEEIAERERRRQVALEHQEAIRQQLEEREKKRRDERERRIFEEREEEQRIEKEKEMERKRKENEEKLLKEKLEREQKRKLAIQEALEVAEREAKRDKIKLKLLKQNNINNNINVNEIIEKEKVGLKSPSPREDIHIINNNISNENEFNEEKLNNNEKSKERIYDNKFNETKLNNVNEVIKNDNEHFVQQPLSLNSCDSLSLVLQTPLETLQNMQFAVFMPTSGAGPSTALPIAVPITLPTEGNISVRTENRILTPTLFRNKHFCDSSTQTEMTDFKTELDSAREKILREKLNNLDLNFDSRSRKDRRIRDDRSRDNVEERPKWGANRPPTRYLKQSEKDPLYQRRKLRQKMRQVKTYDDKRSYSPHSSDESQTGSPRCYRKNMEKRHGRALWRKSDQMFPQNIRLYQTELVPLESDKEHIYYKTKSPNECCCRCQCNKDKYHDRIKVIDILKIDHNSPPQDEDANGNRLPCYNLNGSIENSGDVIHKLNSLHNGLFLKQEQWQNTPTTPSLSTTRRNSENIS